MDRPVLMIPDDKVWLKVCMTRRCECCCCFLITDTDVTRSFLFCMRERWCGWSHLLFEVDIQTFLHHITHIHPKHHSKTSTFFTFHPHTHEPATHITHPHTDREGGLKAPKKSFKYASSHPKYPSIMPLLRVSVLILPRRGHSCQPMQERYCRCGICHTNILLTSPPPATRMDGTYCMLVWRWNVSWCGCSFAIHEWAHSLFIYFLISVTITAVNGGFLDVVKFLIDRGVDYNALDHNVCECE